MTKVAVDLPDEIARRLAAAWPDVSRRALEAIALEGYRDGALPREQVGQLLQFSFWETEAFLKAHRAFLPYAEADLEDDRHALDDLAAR